MQRRGLVLALPWGVWGHRGISDALGTGQSQGDVTEIAWDFLLLVHPGFMNNCNAFQPARTKMLWCFHRAEMKPCDSGMGRCPHLPYEYSSFPASSSLTSAVEDKTLPFSLLCRSPCSGSPAKDAPGSQDGLQLMLGPLGSHSCRLLRVTWRWYGPFFGTLVHCWRWAIAGSGGAVTHWDQPAVTHCRCCRILHKERP